MIHRFEKAGLFIVLDVGSGAVHVVDEMVYTLLGVVTKEQIKNNSFGPGGIEPAQTQYSDQELLQGLDELHQLYEAGLLYSDDSYEEFAAALGPAPVKAMCLHVAHDCNLRCKYCFASTGGFGGARKLMDLDTATAAIDLLVALSGKRVNLEVDFFGGEPLMNYDVVVKTIEYARNIENNSSKHFRFTITTNGVALNEERINSINKEMDNVVLSLDGRESINDAMRPFENGGGSYATIVPKFQKLVRGRGGKEYYVRGTYTKDNLDFDKDVSHLHRLGFDQISVEPVVGPETDSYAIQTKDLPAIRQSYDRLMEDMVRQREEGKQAYNFFHFMLDLDNGPCAIKRLKGCGSGNEYVAVTPEGDIYPCHQFVGNDKFLMGNVEDGLTNHTLKQSFADANLLRKPTCQDCWAKLFCSGGCNANNYTFTGSILEPHALSCELEKMRLESAIAMQALAIRQPT